MNSFFSPKSRVFVSRPLALLMNTLNLLGPVLLLCAVILLGSAQVGGFLPEFRQALLTAAALLVAAALVIRIAWGISVRWIAARHRRKDADNAAENADPE